MAQAFWKLLPTDLQRHLRVEGNIHSEATFWETRKKQKAMEAKWVAVVCYQCRHAENLIKRAR
jgi:hypothetical protein